MKKFITLASLVMGMTAAATGCGMSNQGASKSTNQGNTAEAARPMDNLSVLYAGSMTKVMEQKIGPNIHTALGLRLQGEGKGSTALGQMIRSGLAQPDVFISASPGVNTDLLMGAKNRHLVSWFLTLAEDQLVIAYSQKSTFAPQLKQAQEGRLPWYQVLEAKGFQLGRTDPLLDPKGKKTIFMFELASLYYHQPGLVQQVLGSTENPKQVFPEESLLARLTSGQIDAIVAYKHEAVEWGVPYITLPPQVNLGSTKFANYYQQASFKGKDGKIAHGSPIVFTITIPSTAKNKSGAAEFVRYMVSGHGHALLLHDGFIPMKTKLGGSMSAVPSSLKSLIQGTWDSR